MAEPATTEATWNDVYTHLYTYVRRLVHHLNVPRWQGQEEEMAWDIVQESVSRFLTYAQKVERGERAPVRSMLGLLKVIARHYSRDLRRRDWRLRPEGIDMSPASTATLISIEEVAVENVYRLELFRTVAHEIARFPKKQRWSLLMDLARLTAFAEKPTALQMALRAEGIFLEGYRTEVPRSEQERRQQASLRNHAYKRLSSLPRRRQYLSS